MCNWFHKNSQRFLISSNIDFYTATKNTSVCERKWLVLLLFFHLFFTGKTTLLPYYTAYRNLIFISNSNNSEASHEFQGHQVFIETCPSAASRSIFLLSVFSLFSNLKFLTHLNVPLLPGIFPQDNLSPASQPALCNQMTNTFCFVWHPARFFRVHLGAIQNDFDTMIEIDYLHSTNVKVAVYQGRSSYYISLKRKKWGFFPPLKQSFFIYKQSLDGIQLNFEKVLPDLRKVQVGYSSHRNLLDLSKQMPSLWTKDNENMNRNLLL